MDQMALLFRLMVLMAGRWPRRLLHSLDVGFVSSRAQGDYEQTEGDSGILHTAATLYSNSNVQFLAVFGSGAGQVFGGELSVSTTHPGYKEYIDQLVSLGVPKNKVHCSPDGPVHTRGECDAFVELAKQEYWQTAVAIMQPHQALRTMLSFLKSFEQHDYRMLLLPVCPQSVNWSKEVYGSQGAQSLKRHQHIAQEWKRILHYQGTGELATFEELDAYLTSMLE